MNDRRPTEELGFALRAGIVGMAWLEARAASITAMLRRGQVAAIRSRVSRSYSPEVPESVVRAALAACEMTYEGSLETVTDCAIIMARRVCGEGAVLKVAATRKGVSRLRCEQDALNGLHSQHALGEWRRLLPVPLGFGDVIGGSYLAMSRLEGSDARYASLAEPQALTHAAFQAIAPLHSLDFGMREVSAELLRDLIDIPMDRLRAIAGRRDAIDLLRCLLHDELADRPLRIGWTHGDFAYGNLMLDNNGGVTGIVDWGQSREHDLVSVDLAFWLLAMPMPDEPQEFGARVAARLRRDQVWRDYEVGLLAEAAPDETVSGPALLLLAWLRHVTDNLDKSDRFAGPLWYRRNVVPVLRVIAHRRHIGQRVTS